MNLQSDDLFHLRMSCRYLCECSLFRFIQCYFHTCIHLLTQHSLETLLEISRHSGPSIRTLGITSSPGRLSDVGWEHAYETYSPQKSGLFTTHLTQVLANMVGCRTVILNYKCKSPWGNASS